jgi:transposase
MSKPYSYDLRQKVIQAIKLDGLKISEASVLFSISRNTIGLWFWRQAETGDFQALLGRAPR